jgi:hypothetical protein
LRVRKEQKHSADFDWHPLLELDVLTQLYIPHGMRRARLRYRVCTKANGGDFLIIRARRGFFIGDAISTKFPKVSRFRPATCKAND